MRGLSGKRAIITGGGSGIGRALCQRFGEEGTYVAVFDINFAGAEATVNLIESAGGIADAFEVDITSRDAVFSAVAKVESAGPIDILVNNAGWDVVAPFLDSSLEHWENVNNIASDSGRVGSSGEAVYLARKGVQINNVCPGPTDTPLLAEFTNAEGGERIAKGLKRAIPMKRLAEPEDYPGIVCFLASDDAGFITGQTISVSGGLTMHG